MIPLFSSHFSIGESILTLEDPEKVKLDGPKSIFSLVKEYNISPIYLCDSSFTGFPEFYKMGEELSLDIRYGLKLVITENGSKKDRESRSTEHKIILWACNTKGYYDLIKIWTKAATDFFYYYPRIDEKTLKSMLTEDLTISLPFYSSFIAKNALYFNKCLFDYEYFKPAIFTESNDLPIDKIISDAVLVLNKKAQLEALPVKTIYYEKREDFKAWQTFRCIHERTLLEKPNLDHCSSAEFSLESWKDISVK